MCLRWDQREAEVDSLLDNPLLKEVRSEPVSNMSSFISNMFGLGALPTDVQFALFEPQTMVGGWGEHPPGLLLGLQP